MEEAPPSQTVSTKLERIAKRAREAPDMALRTLAHHIDVDWLKEAYRRTRKNGAKGVDGVSADEYARDLDKNLRSLYERAKAGTYHAPPVRRVNIPKSDGRMRPIGIPTFEDKILQRAVAMVLEAVYEEEFLDCSYGFRPGRSTHDALKALREATMNMRGGWILEDEEAPSSSAATDSRNRATAVLARLANLPHEEPDAAVLHVRICGSSGRETSRRYPTAILLHRPRTTASARLKPGAHHRRASIAIFRQIFSRNRAA
jgi:hypothetical protein